MSNMMSSTAVESEAAQIREDTESAYVNMFTADMVTLCVQWEGKTKYAITTLKFTKKKIST